MKALLALVLLSVLSGCGKESAPAPTGVSTSCPSGFALTTNAQFARPEDFFCLNPVTGETSQVQIHTK